jgi:hypothetical protein
MSPFEVQLQRRRDAAALEDEKDRAGGEEDDQDEQVHAETRRAGVVSEKRGLVQDRPPPKIARH